MKNKERNMLVYLDNCCYNRPFDEQKDLLVRLETEAKLFIQEQIRIGIFDLIWSFVLDYENGRNPFLDKRERIDSWRGLAKIDCDTNDFIRHKARELMQNFNLKQADASHTACAIYANADYFITTDKGILKQSKNIEEIKIVSPITFLEEVSNDK
jgi:predicted nucleic acid-binding protein